MLQQNECEVLLPWAERSALDRGASPPVEGVGRVMNELLLSFPLLGVLATPAERAQSNGH
eukprot:scaffold53196_cov28-Tisochrysis_lutea.AAC.1